MVKHGPAATCFTATVFLGNSLEPRAPELSFLTCCFFPWTEHLVFKHSAELVFKYTTEQQNCQKRDHLFQPSTRANGFIVPLQPVEWCAGGLELTDEQAGKLE